MKPTNRALTHEQVAKILKDFLEGTGRDWDWAGFIDGGVINDPRLEEIRIRSINLSEEFPPTKRGEYTNEQGRQVLRAYLAELQPMANP
jgi:hypothetical protein